MVYTNLKEAVFLSRPNRFIARVLIDGVEETVHVKNTGRLRELLVPGVPVILQRAEQPGRKTAYDLISLQKSGLGWVNIDSQATNRVVKEWLAGVPGVRPEYRYGDSRLDFFIESEKLLLEVKGCTLERDGVGYFPDAPSERAVRHCRELIRAKAEGYRCAVVFVIAMEQVERVAANAEKDPAFAAALREAEAGGVEIWHLPCRVTADTMEIAAPRSRFITERAEGISV